MIMRCPGDDHANARWSHGHRMASDYGSISHEMESRQQNSFYLFVDFQGALDFMPALSLLNACEKLIDKGQMLIYILLRSYEVPCCICGKSDYSALYSAGVN